MKKESRLRYLNLIGFKHPLKLEKLKNILMPRSHNPVVRQIIKGDSRTGDETTGFRLGCLGSNPSLGELLFISSYKYKDL